jgi:hypothetical protein
MSNWTARKAALQPDEITHRLAFNPNYPGIPTGVPGAIGIKIRDKIKPETRERIRQSIDRQGIRNPITAYRTSEGLFLGFGGGRLQAAKALQILVPAIVIDYTGEMVDYEEVTPDNWEEFYTDVPMYFEFNDTGIYTHYGLERNRDEPVDIRGLAWAREEDMQAILKESPWLGEKSE